MAVASKYTKLAQHLLGTSLIFAPLYAGAQQQFPHQQLVCEADQQGGWRCEARPALSGPYPKPPLAEIRRRTETRAPVATAEQAVEQNTFGTTSSWDWVAADELTEQQRCQKHAGCDGAYIEPDANWVDADKSPENAPIRAAADKSQTQGNTVALSGHVQITQGNRALRANSASLNRDNSELTLAGNVELREPGLLIRGTDAMVNTDTGLGHIENAQVLYHQSGSRVTAQMCNRPEEQRVELEGATYTQCEPGDELWQLSAADMTLDQSTGWGSAKHAVLRLMDVPVFYAPYMTFPIDDRRKTGFLWPTIASSSDGFELSAPFYLNLAPNADATLTPRYIADRGTMAEAELRYMNEVSYWEFAGAQLGNDDITGEDRWLASVREYGNLGQHWSTRIDYTKVSDDDYFKDLSVDSLDIRRARHLKQNAQLNFNSSRWAAKLLVSDYQTIDDIYDSPYQRLPQLSVEYRPQTENFHPEIIAELEYTAFDHDESIEEGGNFVTGERTWGELGVSLPMRWVAGYIIPTIKARHVSYQLDELGNPAADDSPSTTTPVASVDMGLFFERNAGRYTQTLEPRVYYLYSEYKDQSANPDFDTKELTFSYNQLFRDTRFSGHDLLDDADQASFGLTSRWIDNSNGREVVTLSAGQIFYFDDRKVGNPSNTSNSLIAAEAQYQPVDNLWLTATTLWDSRNGSVDEGGFSFHYSAENDAIVNLGYRFRRDGTTIAGFGSRDVEQGDFSVVYPIADSWRLLGRYQYDIDTQRSLEEMVGIEYGDCCWMTRLIYQKAADDEVADGIGGTQLENDYTFILEFQLKGLGNLGSSASGLLKESILGFEDRD